RKRVFTNGPAQIAPNWGETVYQGFVKGCPVSFPSSFGAGAWCMVLGPVTGGVASLYQLFLPAALIRRAPPATESGAAGTRVKLAAAGPEVLNLPCMPVGLLPVPALETCHDTHSAF
ncbi:MAG: hypothetical protein Q8Q74_02880, partial [Polaromonas sp.]|nr:hypothetical protein [Polaromonas sp.]